MKSSVYNSSSIFFSKHFTNRVQKISIDAGFTCPNRDGKKAYGGCIYCNNTSFSPFYCTPQKTIRQQLEEGINFFAKKYKTQKYLAYFQAYTNTYAPVEKLTELYNEALSVENVIGLVISTRPDCFDVEVANIISDISKKYFVLVEFGVESTNDQTLKIINRHHTFEDTQNALYFCKQRNIYTGIHLILGLPNETNEQIIETAKKISDLPFNLLKLHQMQIVKNTLLEKDFLKNPQKYRLFDIDEYIELCIKFLENINPDIQIDRFTSEVPADFLIAPKWGRIKNYEFVHKLTKKMAELGTWQGKFYKK